MEDRIFAWGHAPAAADHALFARLIEEVLPRFTLGTTSQEMLKAFAGMDVKSEAIAGVLRLNPYYESQFLDVIRSKSNREDLPSTEAAVVLLGMQNTRNLVLALQARRSIHGGHAEWTKEGKLNLEPNKFVAFALKAEEVLDSMKSEYVGVGFAAGFAFDLMAQLGERFAEDKKAFQSFLEVTFAHGLKAARMATALSKGVTGFAHAKNVFAAALLHDIGKAALALLDRNYLGFVDDCSKKTVPRQVRQYLEERKFGVTHSMLGAVLCNGIHLLRPVRRAVAFHHEPFLLKKRDPNLYPLAAVLSLSSQLANGGWKIDSKDATDIFRIKGVELKDFKIDGQAFMTAAKIS